MALVPAGAVGRGDPGELAVAGEAAGPAEVGLDPVSDAGQVDLEEQDIVEIRWLIRLA